MGFTVSLVWTNKDRGFIFSMEGKTAVCTLVTGKYLKHLNK